MTQRGECYGFLFSARRGKGRVVRRGRWGVLTFDWGGAGKGREGVKSRVGVCGRVSSPREEEGEEKERTEGGKYKMVEKRTAKVKQRSMGGGGSEVEERKRKGGRKLKRQGEYRGGKGWEGR